MIEAELVKAIALAWHDTAGCPIRCAIAHEYLGRVLAWAVQCSQMGSLPPDSHELIRNPDDSDENIAAGQQLQILGEYLDGR